MMRQVLAILMCLTVAVNIALAAETADVQQGDKTLSLKDAIFMALKNNLDLQIQETRTEAARETLKSNKSIFVPTLNMNFENRETNRPATDFLSGAQVSTTKQVSLSTGLSQRIPFGGTVAFSLYNTRYESNSIFSSVNPYLFSQATLTFNQPLLKNFGTAATKYQIYIASNDHKASKLQLKENIVGLVYNVESAYWELVFAHQNLEARKMALKRSQDLLKQNEVKVKVGTAAPIEILSSKAEVARNESQVIQAQQAIHTREENLKRILNLSKEAVSLVPSESPEIRNVEIDREGFLTEALKNRTDMGRARLGLENENVRVKYARSQALPTLDLEAEYWSIGQGGEQIILRPGASPFDPNFNPDVDIIGVVKKSIWKSMGDTFKNEYKNYSVRLNFSMPITLQREKAELALAKVNRKRARLELKNTENTVYSEVREVIRELENNKKLVEAEKIALELARENLKAEEKKLSVGLSTNFEVLDYQRQYTDAETSWLRSMVNYNLTRARLNQVLNRTFKVYNIEFKEE